MLPIDRFVPITEAKNRLLDLAREVQRDDDVIFITRNGVPAAILLSPARFEGLLETLEMLGDARTIPSDLSDPRGGPSRGDPPGRTSPGQLRGLPAVLGTSRQRLIGFGFPSGSHAGSIRPLKPQRTLSVPYLQMRIERRLDGK